MMVSTKPKQKYRIEKKNYGNVFSVGWRYSRITDVKMYQIDTSNTKNPQPKHLIEILNHEGCRNIHLQGIVPNDQAQDTNDPLISTLPLRAFAFQGMKSGQQMILTAKIKGCVEANDCESVSTIQIDI